MAARASGAGGVGKAEKYRKQEKRPGCRLNRFGLSKNRGLASRAGVGRV